jgi:hypothetical protein
LTQQHWSATLTRSCAYVRLSVLLEYSPPRDPAEGGLDARAPEVRNAPVCRREARFEGSTTRNQTTPAAFEGNSRVRVQRRVLRRPTWTPARPRRGCREGEDGMKASPTDTLLRVVDYPSMSNGKKLSMLNVICASPYWRLSLSPYLRAEVCVSLAQVSGWLPIKTRQRFLVCACAAGLAVTTRKGEDSSGAHSTT